jgi:6,7-dimethyl-8-ribityllumazine synthase|tara:strand:+ start:6422 stop:6904 length:483 start_codon:yes stop_codon:yes gene_type:complete
MTKKNTNLSHFNKEEVSNAKGLSFGIVVSEWNGDITDGLYKGAADTLIDCGANANDIKRYDVPGSYELVFGAKIAAKNKPDAIICLGSVIQGETKHFDFVCNAVSMGIKDLNINLNIPVIFGVLTDNTMEQAKNRSGGKFGNKGVEAAITAIKMATLNRK